MKYLLIFILVSLAFHFNALTSGTLMAPLGDPICQNYPIKHLLAESIKGFTFPLWDPYEFAGIPYMGNIQNGALYPFNLALYFLISPEFAYNLNYMLHFALGGFFTFLYLNLICRRPLAAFAGALVYGFSGFMRSHADHIMIANAAAYLPLMMYLYERLRRTQEPRHSLMIALAVAVQVFAGNFQICVYTYIVVAMFMAFNVLGLKDKDARIRFLLFGVLGPALGIIIALPQLVSTLGLSSVSFMRMKSVFMGYDYFSGFHFYLVELPSLIFNAFFSGWGPKDHMQALLGAPVVIMALATAIRLARSDRNVLFWGIVAVASLIMAMGSDTPLQRLLYEVPVYNQFRVVGRHLMEFSLAASVLMALGLDAVFLGGERRKAYLKSFAILSVAVIALAVAAVYVLPLIGLKPIVAYIADKRFIDPWRLAKALSISNPALYMPMMWLSAYAAWALIYRKFDLKPLGYVFIVILLMESSASFKGYMTGNSGTRLSDGLCASEGYDELPPDLGRSRVVNIFAPKEICSEIYNPMANLTCKLGSITAFNPLARDDYSNLLNLGLSGYYSLSWDHLVRNNIILSMLGGKYVRLSKSMGIDPDDIVFSGPLESSPSAEKVLEGWVMKTGASSAGDSYTLAGTPAGRPAEMTLSVPLEQGAYEFCFTARSSENNRYVALYLYEPPSYRRMEALFVHPDYLTARYNEFCQVVHLQSPKEYYLASLISPSQKPVTVKDITFRRFDNYAPAPPSGVQAGSAVYEKLYSTDGADVYLNRNSMPRAWLATTLVPAGDFRDVMRKLNAMEIDIHEQALVYKDDIAGIGKRDFSPGKATIMAYGMNEVSVSVISPGEAFLVLSDQFYPGWKAYVDGKLTPIYRVNGVLRGVRVPGGEHTVTFSFRPYGIFLLMALSTAILAGIIAVLVSGRGKRPASCPHCAEQDMRNLKP